MTRSVWILLIALTGCGGCSNATTDGGGSTNPDGLTEVSLVLNWYPEAEHGGFYVITTRFLP